MQAVHSSFSGPSLPWPSVLQFGGKQNRRNESTTGAVIEQKLAAYRQGWTDLLAKDAQRPGGPLLKRVDVDCLTESARNFLKRQAATEPEVATPFLIGISGSPASGKTTAKNAWLESFTRLANQLQGWKKQDHGPVVESIELDHYYKDLSERRRQLGDDRFFSKTNLDKPSRVDLEAATRDLLRLKNGQAVRTPHYSFVDASHRRGQKLTAPAPFVLVEGLFAFVPKPLRQLMDLKIFFSVDRETIRQRWWKRAPERGVQENEAGHTMFRRAVQGYRKHTKPTREHADIVVNGAAPLADVNATMRTIAHLLLKTFYPIQHG